MCSRYTIGRAEGGDSDTSRRVFFISFLVVALLLSGVAVTAADEHTGEVTGTVSTGDSYALADADVRLVNISTGDTETTTSDANGSYVFEGVEPGEYRVEAGFRGGESVEDITVVGGETRELDLELTPEEAYFTVSVQGTNSPVTAGEDMQVDATVTNRGRGSGSQAVRLEVPGIGDDAEPVSLDGDSSTTVTLSVPTDIDDAGEYTAEASTDDDTAEAEFVVEERGREMDVSITDTNSPVTEGETLTVEARLSNPSGVPASGTVTAEVDGLDSDTARFDLADGAEGTEGFEIPTEAGDAGEYTVTVSVGDATDSTEVTVEEETDGGGDGEDDGGGTDNNGSEDGVNGGEGDGSGTGDENGAETGDNETVSDGDDGGDGDTRMDLGINLREALRYIGMALAAIVAVAVLAGASVLAARRLRDRDWGGDGSEEENGAETVLDTEYENDVYVAWSGMIERAGVGDIGTKTPSEIAESAKEAGLDPGAVDELTDVFEEVRYRDTEPTAEQERRAKEAFERIKRSDREG
jgi:hypothetical protein